MFLSFKKEIYFLFVLCVFSTQYVLAQHPSYKKNRYNRADSLRGALRPERTCFDVTYYDLSLRIDVKKERISGANQVYFKVINPTQKIQLDLYENMKIEKITFENQVLSFTREAEAIFIDFPNELPKDAIKSLTVFYSGRPAVNTGTYQDYGFHWDRDEKGRPWIGVSCEYAGASLWWPNKDHLSDEPDSMRIHLTVPKDLVCISNGKLEKKEKVDESSDAYHWFVNNPIDNYNVSFYLGHYKSDTIHYESVYTKEIKNIEVYYLDYEAKAAKEYFKYVPTFIGFFESVFGEYPFWNDKFAIVHSSYRGMEHQGCLAIDKEMRNYMNWYYFNAVPYHSTLIHEIAHEWWGNAISVSDMADVWLQEGFATYSEFLFIEWNYGYDTYKKSIENLNRNIVGEFPIVGNRDVNDNMFANGDIYFKGAKVIHELREKINDINVFLAVLKTFQTKFKKKVVTTQDFINTVNEVTKADYTQFLKDKLYKK